MRLLRTASLERVETAHRLLAPTQAGLYDTRGGAKPVGPRPSHSSSFDHRRRPETLRTAIAAAFFWPTSTTRRLPRVTPRVEQVAAQHRVVLRQHRDHHGRISAAGEWRQIHARAVSCLGVRG